MRSRSLAWISAALSCNLLAFACSTGTRTGPGGDAFPDGTGGGAPLGGSGGTMAAAAGRASMTGGSSGTASTMGGNSSQSGSGGSTGGTTAGTTGGSTMAGSGGSIAGSMSNGGAGAASTSSGGNGAAGATGAGAGGSSGDGSGAGMSGSGSGGAPAGPCDIGGKILCEDFDSIAAGMLPTGAPWAARNCFDTTNTLKVDGGAHHSGSQALLGMNIPYADCQLSADLGASLSEYWVRAWIYYGTAAPTASTHEVTLFELVPKANTDDPSIRVGYRGDTCMPIGVEVNITGGGQEETGCTGQAPKADTWYCYVLHVKQMASSVTTDLSIDGVDQSYTNHGNAQMEITSQVAGVRYLRLGPRSYSGNWANPIYVDDVAVGTQALGCQ